MTICKFGAESDKHAPGRLLIVADCLADSQKPKPTPRLLDSLDSYLTDHPIVLTIEYVTDSQAPQNPIHLTLAFHGSPETWPYSIAQQTHFRRILDQISSLESSTASADRVARWRLRKDFNAQMDAVLHSPRLSSLMATWNAIAWLLRESRGVSRVMEIFLLVISREDFCRDLDENLREGKTIIQQWTDETPLACLIDFNIGPNDQQFVAQLDTLGTSMHAAILSKASPEFFGATTWEDVSWKRLVDSEPTFPFRWWLEYSQAPSRHCHLTILALPMRMPFGPDNPAPHLEDYTESITSVEDLGLGPTLYVVGLFIVSSLVLHNWPRFVKPQTKPPYSYRFSTDTADIHCVTHHPIVSEQTIAELGFLCPIHLQMSTRLGLFHDDFHLHDVATNPNAFSNLLVTCHFAYVLRKRHRALVGQNIDKTGMTEELKSWLAGFEMKRDIAEELSDRLARPFIAIDVTRWQISDRNKLDLSGITLTPGLLLEGLGGDLKLSSQGPSVSIGPA